jgi:ribonuclease HI
MIAEALPHMRGSRVLYWRGVRSAGSFRTGEAAAQTGLLHGLRVCKRRGWHGVHVVGDNTSVVRQQGQRQAPTEKTHRAIFWTARRTADAIGVVSWRYHPRERNREARSVMSTVTPAGTEADLSKHTERLGAGHLDPITAQAARDITHWWNRQEQQGTSVSEAATV